MSDLTLRPVTLRQARAFVARVHRHSDPPRGWRFGVAAYDSRRELRAVGIAGRPVARLLDDGTTIEILRIASDGAPQACSMLYGALCRAAKALGYDRAATYTLGSEPGTSLRAAGFIEVDRTNGSRTWDRPSRLRDDFSLFGSRRVSDPIRVRWERILTTRTGAPLEAPVEPLPSPSAGRRVAEP